MLRNILFFLIAFASIVPASGQPPMSPDPKAYHIALELSDLPAGSELFSESEFSLQAGSQKDYPAPNREYIIPTSKGKVLIVAVYAILDTKENAAVAFSRYPVHIREHRDDNLVGDRTFGDYPRLTVLLQDRADVGIQLLPMKGYEVQDLKQEQLDAVLSPPLRTSCYKTWFRNLTSKATCGLRN